MRQTQDPLRSVHLHLNAQLIARIAEEAADLNSNRFQILNCFFVTDPMVEQIGRALVQELEISGTAGDLYAESAAQLLAVHLLRHYSDVEAKASQPIGKLPRAYLQQVIDFIRSNIGSELSLTDIAAVINMSSYHFAHLFKETTGETPHQYVVRFRLEEAQKLLRETKLSTLEIALAIGYNSPSHFSAQFKRYFGVSPIQYRRSC
jgi:AraC family transcriptional regulator